MTWRDKILLELGKKMRDEELEDERSFRSTILRPTEGIINWQKNHGEDSSFWENQYDRECDESIQIRKKIKQKWAFLDDVDPNNS